MILKKSLLLSDFFRIHHCYVWRYTIHLKMSFSSTSDQLEDDHTLLDTEEYPYVRLL